MPREKGKDIHALPQKLGIMAEVLFEREKIDNESISQLSEYCGIKYETLKVSRSKGRLSSVNEIKLSETLGFDIGDAAWVDTSVSASRRSHAEGYDYPGRDTAAEFRYLLRTLHELPAGEFLRIESLRPDHLDRNLALLELSDSGQQTAAGQALQLFFSIIIEPGYHDGLCYGFCRVRLRFNVMDKSHIKSANRLASNSEVEIAGAMLSVRGQSHAPEWYLTVDDRALKGEYLCRTPLCHVMGGKVGNIFRAELSVRPEDGALWFSLGDKLPAKTKKIIIERLYAKRLKECVDTQGWLTLGMQELRVVRADQL